MAKRKKSSPVIWPCIIVGAGAAGIGIARALQEVGVPFLIIERHEIGGTFRRWPREMRFITPSFPSNSFGTLDLNSIAIGTSPAFTLECEHPTGDQYADYLLSVVDYFKLPIKMGIDVLSITPQPGGGFELQTSEGPIKAQHVIWAAGEFQ